MTFHYPFLFLIFFINSLITSYAQPFHSDLIYSYRDILELKIKEPPTEVANKYPDGKSRAFIIYQNSLADLIKLLIVKDENEFKQSLRNYDSFTDELKTLGKNEPFVSFVDTELRLHEGLLRLAYGDQFYGAIRLFQASRQNNQNISDYENMLYFKKTAGVLTIILSLIPEKYAFILNLLNIRPDMGTGLNQLSDLSTKENIFQREGTYLLALFNAFYLRDFEKSYTLLDSINSSSNDLMYNYLYAMISIKARNNDKAIQYLKKCKTTGTTYLSDFYLIDYLLGVSYLKKLDFDTSEYHLSIFTENTNKEDYIKDSYYQMYIIKTLTGNIDSARYFKQKVLNDTTGKLSTEADINAFINLSDTHKDHPQLIRSRLLFDGGYYSESLKILEKMQVTALTDFQLFQFYYRTGRVYQMTGKHDLAIVYFRNTIAMDKYSDHYLYANSHLQLGEIFLSKKDRSQAEYHFNLALRYKGDHYRESIRNEARTGLQKIKDF